MGELPVWSDLDGSTEDGNARSNSTVAVSTTARHVVASQSVSATVLAAVGVAIMSVGIVANSGVLAVLVRARRQFASSVLTLITNQCAMELQM